MPSFSANLRPAAKAGWIVRSASVHLRNPAKGQSEVPMPSKRNLSESALVCQQSLSSGGKGIYERGDVENRLGYHVGQLGR